MKVLSTAARMGLAAVLVLASSMALRAQSNDLAVNKAKEFIQLLQKGDFDAAFQRVDSNLGFKANPETFRKYWQNLVSKAGNFVEFKDAKVENQNGTMVVIQVAKFERGHVDLKVALDNSLRVAGFQYANHESAKSTAQAQPHAQAQPQQGEAQAAAAVAAATPAG